MGWADEDLHGLTYPQQFKLFKLSPRAKLSLKLHADQAYGSIQWKMTHWPSLCQNR